MERYLEPARELPVVYDADVVVAGAGPAGFGAALAATRAGAKVVLLERFNNIGGMATSGLMSHFTGSVPMPIYQEVIDEVHSLPSFPLQENQLNAWQDSQLCRTEPLKTAFQRLLLRAGVTIQYHTFVVGAMMHQGRVTGVITESKSGREAIAAKVVVDATGDGDVAASAGAEFTLGREGDHKCQPVSLMFRLGGVDYSRAIFPGSFETLVQVPNGEIQALGREQLPFPAGHTLLYKNNLLHEVTVNMTNAIDIDATDVRDLTKAEIQCREQIEAIIPFLRKNAPGYENCYLETTAENVGVRETRHFAGLYTVQSEDILEGRVFDDWIATRNFFNFDIHSLKGPGLDEHGVQKKFHAKGVYTVPYRSCVPARVDGVLLSGRNICGTHLAHSNYRVMGICMGIGEGVGVAAALAAKQGLQPRDVDPAEVQRILLGWGVEV